MTTDSKIADLTQKIEDLITLVNNLHSEIKGLRKKNGQYKREIKQLKEKLAKYEHPWYRCTK